MTGRYPGSPEQAETAGSPGAAAVSGANATRPMQPTVSFLIVLVLAEYGLLLLLRYIFRHVHGG